MLLAALLLAGGGGVADARPAPTQSWIVVLRDGADVDAAVGRARRGMGIRPEHAYRSSFRGYAGRLTAAQRARLLTDPDVVAVVPDAPVELDAQSVPPGISRVGANPSVMHAVDGSDPALDVDIAIIDTGIASHADLRIGGGYNCTTSDTSAWGDQNTHGTHVAGAAAARDNDIGVVGVAPGARVWAVKVMDASGGGLVSWLICGLDWVATQADPDDPSRPLFEVANMSLSVRAGDDGNCGQTAVPTAYDLLHAAICRVNGAGVATVVAAGNYSDNLAVEPRVPAAYGEVITVGAICDSDGVAGGNGPNCQSTYVTVGDDRFAGFSNYGAAVDLVAPGSRVWSTMPGGGYGYKDGTSLATPHVAGAAALYHLREAELGRPRPTPEQVRAGLVAAGKLDWKLASYPLGAAAAPPLLDVASLALAPGFGISATPVARRAGAGESVFYDVALGRYGGFEGEITLDVSGLPAGAAWTAGAGATVASDTQRWQRVMVDLPTGEAPGTYQLSINASADGVAGQSVAVTLQYEGATFAVGPLPRLNLLGGTVAGVPFPARISWPPVSGAQRYELQYSHDEGPWQPITLRKALTHKVGFKAWPGASYRFRTRTLTNGTWGEWLTSRLYVVTPEMALDDHISLTGAWSGQSPKNAYSERIAYSSATNARLRFEFVGRSVAWLATRGPGRGKAAVYLDGSRVATVDLYASSNRYRRIVFRRAWPDAGSHVLEIVVLGTPGRPRVDVDAIVFVSAN